MADNTTRPSPLPNADNNSGDGATAFDEQKEVSTQTIDTTGTPQTEAAPAQTTANTTPSPTTDGLSSAAPDIDANAVNSAVSPDIDIDAPQPENGLLQGIAAAFTSADFTQDFTPDYTPAPDNYQLALEQAAEQVGMEVARETGDLHLAQEAVTHAGMDLNGMPVATIHESFISQESTGTHSSMEDLLQEIRADLYECGVSPDVAFNTFAGDTVAAQISPAGEDPGSEVYL